MDTAEQKSSPTACAIQKAHRAFVTNTTISSYNWKQRQLYGLCRLLITHGEKLTQALYEKYNISKIKYDQELAVVLRDISRHYTAGQNTTAKPNKTPWGTIEQKDLPVGISMLLLDTANPIRFLFSSLAANIAVGNTIILASYHPRDADPFFQILQRHLPEYLDSEAIHVLPSVERDSSLLSKVDLISVFGENADQYSDILCRPNAKFYSTKGGSSLVVFDEGTKSYDKAAAEIHQSFSFHGLRPESVTAVFIREVEVAAFEASFAAISLNHSSDKPTMEFTEPDFTPFASFSCLVELAKLSGPRATKIKLPRAIETADKAGVLLVITYRSLDQVIEALKMLQTPCKYLGLLAPYNKANGDYFQKWTTSDFFSLGSIPSVIPYSFGLDVSAPKHISLVLFPMSLFAKTRISISAPETEPPQSVEAVMQYVQIYVKMPKPAPNQTMEFFGYMKRVIICLGLFIGGVSISGVYLWYRSFN